MDENNNETLTDSFKRFLSRFEIDTKRIYDERISQMELSNQRSLVIDFNHLLIWNDKIAYNLLNNPSEYLEAFKTALIERLLIHSEDFVKKHRRKFFIRIKNIPEINQIRLRDLREKHFEKLIQFSGVVTEVSSVNLLMVRGTFICNRCGTAVEVIQDSIEIRRPSECPQCERRSSFTLDLHQSEFIDIQKIVIQESLEDLPSGHLPRSIICYLKNDLTDITKPGERVIIVGISTTRINSRSAIATKYIEVNYLENIQIDVDEVVVTQEEKEQIIKLSKNKNIFDIFVQSLAPSIFGLEHIKQAIILSLFGGCFYRHQDPSKRRGEIHTLIIGDPGLGKSVLLKNAEQVTPRSIYTTGRGSSAAGLTAAVIREKERNNFTIRAGTFVLADKGVAYIDEFEKMKKDDMQSIHEPLEQLTISVAKAGINMTLNARTTVIAAANPQFGRYDPYKTPAENIKVLKPTIFSRFDLIFVLKDIPNKQEDEKLANFMLSKRENIRPKIDRNIFKKYIFYARKKCMPKISTEAQEKLKNFYIKIRSLGYREEADDAAISITPRYLEALMRLTEAHAKIHLKDIADESDSEFAIKILSRSLYDVGIDPETGLPDIDRIETGFSRSRKDRQKSLYEVIKQFEKDNNRGIEKEELIEKVSKYYHDISNLDSDLVNLINMGKIYVPKSNVYKAI